MPKINGMIRQEIEKRFGVQERKYYETFGADDKRRYFAYLHNFISGKRKNGELLSPTKWVSHYRDFVGDPFMEFVEIAKAMGTSEANVRNYYKSAMNKLRSNMKLKEYFNML